MTALMPYPSLEGAESPWEYLDYLLEQAPVLEMPDRPNHFLISRYEDVRYALSHPEIFSSKGARAGLFGFDPLLGTAPGESRLMSEFDPPEVKAKRELGLTALKPGRLKDHEPLIRGIVDDLIDAFVDRGRCEFVEEFSRPLPARLTIALMGVPDDDLPFVREWAKLETGGMVFMPPEFQARQRELGRRMASYLEERVLERHAEPRDDLISVVVQAQVERDAELDLPEVTSVVSALLSGGMVTTGHFVATMLRLLVENPEQMAALRRDPHLIPPALEEGLRLEPPTMWRFRRVAVDTELHGVRMPAGAVVLLMAAAANRTAEKFECPARFDPERPNVRDHLTFGHGPHTCLGSPLARIELRIAFERLLRRLDNIRLASGGEVVRVASAAYRGLDRLDIEFDPLPA